MVEAEPPEAVVAGLPDVLRLAADAARRRVGLAADVAELGGEDDLVASAPDGLADQRFVVADAIHIGGVEEVDAEVEGAVDGRR